MSVPRTLGHPDAHSDMDIYSESTAESGALSTLLFTGSE